VLEDDAWRRSRSAGPGKGALEDLMRERIRGIIESIVAEELEAALDAAASQRVGAVRTDYGTADGSWRMPPTPSARASSSEQG
jgi:hypothetical protein